MNGARPTSTALYERYAAALARVPVTGRVMPYDWAARPDPLTVDWMAYAMMFDEFARSLSNELNAFTRDVRRLSAWAAVVQDMTDDQKLEAKIEFIDALATVLVNAPYAIRSRFIFAAAHLCHQANRRADPDWVDAFPLDEKVQLATADDKGRPWGRRYGRLKLRIETIANRAFNDAVQDFRHAYTHRCPPSFVIGLSGFVTRTVNEDTGGVRYAFGDRPALELDAVAALLTTQRDRMYLAFDAFVALVRAHEERMAV